MEVFLLILFIFIVLNSLIVLIILMLLNTNKNNNNNEYIYNNQNNVYKSNLDREISLPETFVKGKKGENNVIFELSNKLSDEYLILNNTLFKIGNRTSQIDHIVVSKYGIFVIETKYYSGYIIGKSNDNKWTYVAGKKKIKIDNPVIQNNIHVNFLVDLLHLNYDVFIPIVCISGNCNLNVEYNKTVRIENLVFRIQTFKEEILPNYKVIYDKLNFYNIIDSNEIRKHVQRINEKKKISKSDIQRCPDCGGKLRKKKGIYGYFLGCSNYPNCKYIKK